MKIKKILIYLLKLTVSVLAVLYIVKEVGSEQLLTSIKDARLLALIPAFLFYMFSQYLSTLRLGNALKCANVNIHVKDNFRLYLIGMAYNLFLPGGIGGDAYKVVYLNKRYDTTKKKLAAALLLDRLMGLLAIVCLIALLAAFTGIRWEYHRFLPALIPVVLYTAHLLCKLIFPSFYRFFASLTLWSLAVQISQLAAVFILAWSLGITEIFSLGTVFFLSSLATAVPVFLGGIGARELVFGQMAVYFGLPSGNMVAVAVMFSLITLISAVPGLIADWMDTGK